MNLEEIVAELKQDVVDVKDNEIRVQTHDLGELIIRPGDRNFLDESSTPPVLYLTPQLFEAAKRNKEKTLQIARRVLSEIKKRAEAKPAQPQVQQTTQVQIPQAQAAVTAPAPQTQPRVVVATTAPQVQPQQTAPQSPPQIPWKSSIAMKYDSLIRSTRKLLDDFRAPFEIKQMFEKTVKAIDEAAQEAEQAALHNVQSHLDRLLADVLSMTASTIIYSAQGATSPYVLANYYTRVLMYVNSLRQHMKLLQQRAQAAAAAKPS